MSNYLKCLVEKIHYVLKSKLLIPIFNRDNAGATGIHHSFQTLNNNTNNFSMDEIGNIDNFTKMLGFSEKVIPSLEPF